MYVFVPEEEITLELQYQLEKLGCEILFVTKSIDELESSDED